MDLKGIDIGFFHDLLRDGVQATPTQRARAEPFDVCPVKYKMTPSKDPIGDDLNSSSLEHELDPNRLSFIVDKLNVQGNAEPIGGTVTRPW